MKFTSFDHLVGPYKQRSCALSDECRKRSLQLSVVSGIRNLDLPTDCASRLLYLPRLGLSLLIVRIYEHAENGCRRHQLVEQAESLRLRRSGQQADARGVSAWPAKTGDQSDLD